MDAPQNLKHKPIIAVNNYDKIDALYANDSEVRALSIGQAQYDNNEISLKIWRHTGKKWSRQSEEMPLHRNIDLNILLLGSLLADVSSNYAMTSLREEISQKDKVEEIQNYYETNKKFLRPRLEELKNVLNTFFEREMK
jgi:hypothetical protein